MPDKSARKPFTLRLPADLKAQLEAQAELDRRPLSHLLEAVLTNWLEGELYTPIRRPEPERQAEPETAFRRPTGRPRQPNEEYREPWLIATLERELNGCSILTFEEIMLRLDPAGEAHPNFPPSVKNQLALIGWQERERLADGALVWLSPDALREHG